MTFSMPFRERTPPSLLVPGLVLLALAGAAMSAAMLTALDLVVQSQLRILLLVAAGAALALVALGPRPLGVACATIAIATIAMNGVRAGGGATLSDVFLALSLVLLAPALLDRGTFRYLLEAREIMAGAALIVVAALVASFLSRSPTESMLNAGRLGLAVIGLQVLVAAWAPGIPQVRRVTWALVMLVAISGLFGILVNRLPSGRAVGFAVDHNHLALTTVIAFGPALALFVISRPRDRVLAGALLLALAGAALFSGSRSGAIGIVAVVTLFVAAWGVRGWLSLYAAGAGVLLVGVVLFATGALELSGSNALSRLAGTDGSGAEESNRERIELLNQTVKQLESSPLIGSGLDRGVFGTHNVYLQLWEGAGVVALIGFGVIVLVMLRRFRLLQRWLAGTADRGATVLAIGLTVSFLAYLVFGVFQNMLWDRYIWIGPALATALIVHINGLQQADPSAEGGQAGEHPGPRPPHVVTQTAGQPHLGQPPRRP